MESEEAVPASTNSLESKYQREINRILDSDRITRKRGLQKLLDDLPWAKKSGRKQLQSFLKSSLIPVLIPTVADTVEKCRELSLSLFGKCLEVVNSIDSEVLLDVSVKLCQRINENPFPEPAEELRIKVVELLLQLKSHKSLSNIEKKEEMKKIDEIILKTLPKTLNDSFPLVKRGCGELIVNICNTSPELIKYHFNHLLKNLVTNTAHQHSKTRSITLRAIGKCLCHLSEEEYLKVMKDTLLNIFRQLLADRTGNVRIELAKTCSSLLKKRWEIQLLTEHEMHCTMMDIELVVTLFLLYGDPIEEVGDQGETYLKETMKGWIPSTTGNGIKTSGNFDENSHIIDGEAELKKMEIVEDEFNFDEKMKEITENPKTVQDFLNIYAQEVLENVLNGVNTWTTEGKERYLHGLDKLLMYLDGNLDNNLPLIINSLGSAVRDDETSVRNAAEECCSKIGFYGDFARALEYILPIIRGLSLTGDSATVRTNAMRILTHIIAGYVKKSPDVGQTENILFCREIAQTLVHSSIYGFSEVYLKEALLLLVRMLWKSFLNSYCDLNNLDNVITQRCICFSLVMLSGRFPGDLDVLVSDMAKKELGKFALFMREKKETQAIKIDGTQDVDISEDISNLLSIHFEYILFRISHFENITDDTIAHEEHIKSLNGPTVPLKNPRWEPTSPEKAGFEVLVGLCPISSWKAKNHTVIQLIEMQVQPPEDVAPGTAEYNEKTYAAQRGDEVIPTSLGEIVAVRLSLLAVLEGLIQEGSRKWEVGKEIAEMSEIIVRKIFLPNLVWRVGRVEGTIRKVTLAGCFSLLKAGAVSADILFKTAQELVPILVSHLDDHDSSTPREMACHCLNILFARLKGAFGEQAIREIYPKLLARLDDSSDVVRIAICSCLEKFFQCGIGKDAYSSTTIDYTLDQLFIHLDDPQPEIQEAVFKVIVILASLDKDLVLKKAGTQRDNHRTPVLCDRVIVEVQGFEILN